MSQNLFFTVFLSIFSLAALLFLPPPPPIFPPVLTADIKLRVLRILNWGRKQLFVLLTQLWEGGKVGKR